MNAEHARQLDAILATATNFDYSRNACNSRCGCVAWQIAQVSPVIEKPHLRYMFTSAQIVAFLELDIHHAQMLFWGQSDHDRLDCSKDTTVARARHCLREIATKHGVNLDAPVAAPDQMPPSLRATLDALSRGEAVSVGD